MTSRLGILSPLQRLRRSEARTATGKAAARTQEVWSRGPGQWSRFCLCSERFVERSCACLDPPRSEGLSRALCEIVPMQQNARASGEVQASSRTSGLCSPSEMVRHAVSQVVVSIHTPSRLQCTEQVHSRYMQLNKCSDGTPEPYAREQCGQLCA